jgi:hypothetical protein
MVGQCGGFSCVIPDGTALGLSGLDLRRCNRCIGLFENDVWQATWSKTEEEQRNLQQSGQVAPYSGAFRCCLLLAQQFVLKQQ